MNPSLAAAVVALLQNDSRVNVLVGGADSIIGAGRLRQGSAGVPTAMPAIVLQEGGSSDNPSDLPFGRWRLYLRIYDAPTTSGGASYLKINALKDACIKALHGRAFPARMSYFSAFELRYDNYTSAEEWDMYLQLPYRTVRFSAYGAWL